MRDERGVRREVQTGPWNLGSVLSVLSVPGRVFSCSCLSLSGLRPLLPSRSCREDWRKNDDQTRRG